MSELADIDEEIERRIELLRRKADTGPLGLKARQKLRVRADELSGLLGWVRAQRRARGERLRLSISKPLSEGDRQ